MVHTPPEDSFVYTFFTTYYTEVIREKQKALSKAGPHLPALDDAKISHIVESTMARLELCLKEAEEHALKGGGYIQSGFRVAQYVAVALTDEVFLNMNWQGQSYWDKNILESRLFNSRKAGEKFFSELNDFLDANDVLRTDVAAIYLHALALGFEGKYRDSQEIAALDVYIGRLYEFIYRQSPKIFTHDYPLAPDAYAHTIEDAEPQMLPDPYRWYYYYLGGVVVFLLATYVMWFDATFELKTGLFEIIQLGK